MAPNELNRSTRRAAWWFGVPSGIVLVLAALVLAVISGLSCRIASTPRVEPGSASKSPETSDAGVTWAGWRGGVRVPFELFSNNILVPVRINGGDPALFIVDTGAAVSVIDEAWAREQGLIVEGHVNLNAGGGAVEGRFARGVNVALRGLRGTNQLLAVLALDRLPPLFGRPIRGILGNTFLKDYVVAFDYGREVLTFHSPALRSLTPEPRALPVENRGGIPFVNLTLTLEDASAISGWFEIDSGSSGSLQINRPFAEQQRILNRVPRHLQSEGMGGAGLGGDMKCIDARIRSIQWGSHVLSQPLISVSQDEKGVGAGGDDGFLGGEVLRRFTVVLDYPSQRVLLVPNSSFPEPFQADLSGLELMTAADDLKRIQIKHVREGFPAARAGLRPGDVIVSLNGRSARKLNLDQCARRLRQPGSGCRLEIRRDAETFRAQLDLPPRLTSTE